MMTDNGFILTNSVVDVTCGCCKVIVGFNVNSIEPPLGGVGNMFTKFELDCRGGVTVWYSVAFMDSSQLVIDDVGLNGGLFDSRLGCDFVTLLKALIRGTETFISIGFCGAKFDDGKYGRLLLFGITNANSPVGRRDGINCIPPT